MKRYIMVVTALVAITASIWLVRSVQAASTVTPEVVDRISARCTENLATLNRLHQNDAFLRTNRGGLYRTIADKLMIPLNRRLADNQQDGAALLTITSNYNKEYTAFSRAYIEYDNALSKVLDIDCRRQPVSFYNALTEAREKRETLHDRNDRLREFITEYGDAFDQFRDDFEETEE